MLGFHPSLHVAWHYGINDKGAFRRPLFATQCIALARQPPAFNAIAEIPAADKRCFADSRSVAEWNGPRRTR